MVKAEWVLMLTTGPDVGSTEVADVDAAADAVAEAFRGAFGAAYGPDHERGAREMTNALRREAPAALAESGRWVWTGGAIQVVLTG